MGMIHQQTGGPSNSPDVTLILLWMESNTFTEYNWGLSYKINDWLSVFAGGRMNYVKSGYEGYLKELK